MDVLYLFVSLGLLYFGAESLVNGSASLALKMGVSPLVVGLTVVAYGTSMPELLVSVEAALGGNPSIALGNVVGSNIFNIAAILGLSALVYPIHVELKLIRIDTPIMIGITLLAVFLFATGALNRLTGVLLLFGAFSYTVLSFWMARRQREVTTGMLEEVPGAGGSWKRALLLIALGGLLLAGGARLLVYASVHIATAFGISEVVIGLTIVAFGTSVPELATSVVAAIRKQPDIAVGNVVGSNIFNILFILGSACTIAPMPSESLSSLDLFAMSITALLLFPVVWSERKISRAEGGVLLGIYVLYFLLLYTSRV